jgi:hypothetical protein
MNPKRAAAFNDQQAGASRQQPETSRKTKRCQPAAASAQQAAMSGRISSTGNSSKSRNTCGALWS